MSSISSPESSYAQAGPPRSLAIDAKHYLDGEPPMGFFLNAPSNAHAMFSTKRGKQQKKNLTDIVAPRVIYPWSARQIDEVAHDILACNREFLKYLYRRQPVCYFDLYNYWDTYELWHMGVQNCWNVLNHLHFLAQQETPVLIKKIRGFLEEWLGDMLKDSGLRIRLSIWDSTIGSDPLNDVFEGDEIADLDGLDAWWTPLVNEVIFNAHKQLREGTYVLPVPTTDEPSTPSNLEAIKASADLDTPTSVDESATDNKATNGIVIVDGTCTTAAKRLRADAVAAAAATGIEGVASTTTSEAIKEPQASTDAAISSGTESAGSIARIDNPKVTDEAEINKLRPVSAVTTAAPNPNGTWSGLAPPAPTIRISSAPTIATSFDNGEPSDKKNESNAGNQKSADGDFLIQPKGPDPGIEIYSDNPPVTDYREWEGSLNDYRCNPDYFARTSLQAGPIEARKIGMPMAKPTFARQPPTAPRADRLALQRVSSNESSSGSPGPRTHVPAYYESRNQFKKGGANYKNICNNHKWNRNVSAFDQVGFPAQQSHRSANGFSGPYYPLQGQGQGFGQRKRQAEPNYDGSRLSRPDRHADLHGSVCRHAAATQNAQSGLSQSRNQNANVSNLANDVAPISGSVMGPKPDFVTSPPYAPNQTSNAGPRFSYDENNRSRRDTDSSRSSRTPRFSDCKNYAKHKHGDGPKGRPEHQTYVDCACFRCKNLNRSIWVGSFDDRFTSMPEARSALLQHFSPYGPIEAYEVKSQGRGALIRFLEERSIWEAIKANNGKPIPEISDHPVRVNPPIGSMHFVPFRPFTKGQQNSQGHHHHSDHTTPNAHQPHEMPTSFPPEGNATSRNIQGPVSQSLATIFVDPVRVDDVLGHRGFPTLSTISDVPTQSEESSTEGPGQMKQNAASPPPVENEQDPMSANPEQNEEETNPNLVVPTPNDDTTKPFPNEMTGQDADAHITTLPSDGRHRPAHDSTLVLKNTETSVVTPKRNATSSERRKGSDSKSSRSDELVRKIEEVCATASRQSSRSGTPTRTERRTQKSYASATPAAKTAASSEKSLDQGEDLSPPRNGFDLKKEIGGDIADGTCTVVRRPHKAKYLPLTSEIWAQNTSTDDHGLTSNTVQGKSKEGFSTLNPAGHDLHHQGLSSNDLRSSSGSPSKKPCEKGLYSRQNRAGDYNSQNNSSVIRKQRGFTNRNAYGNQQSGPRRSVPQEPSFTYHNMDLQPQFTNPPSNTSAVPMSWSPHTQHLGHLQEDYDNRVRMIPSYYGPGMMPMYMAPLVPMGHQDVPAVGFRTASAPIQQNNAMTPANVNSSPVRQNEVLAPSEMSRPLVHKSKAMPPSSVNTSPVHTNDATAPHSTNNSTPVHPSALEKDGCPEPFPTYRDPIMYPPSPTPKGQSHSAQVTTMIGDAKGKSGNVADMKTKLNPCAAVFESPTHPARTKQPSKGDGLADACSQAASTPSKEQDNRAISHNAVGASSFIPLLPPPHDVSDTSSHTLSADEQSVHERQEKSGEVKHDVAKQEPPKHEPIKHNVHRRSQSDITPSSTATSFGVNQCNKEKDGKKPAKKNRNNGPSNKSSGDDTTDANSGPKLRKPSRKYTSQAQKRRDNVPSHLENKHDQTQSPQEPSPKVGRPDNYDEEFPALGFKDDGAQPGPTEPVTRFFRKPNRVSTATMSNSAMSTEDEVPGAANRESSPTKVDEKPGATEKTSSSDAPEAAQPGAYMQTDTNNKLSGKHNRNKSACKSPKKGKGKQTAKKRAHDTQAAIASTLASTASVVDSSKGKLSMTDLSSNNPQSEAPSSTAPSPSKTKKNKKKSSGNNSQVLLSSQEQQHLAESIR
ncbi:uncharacterized protein BCR38DRAFT_476487 [Pseudomassariella vexata]|uniref:RRM domain-containing protein n=1 Tax=Pseudomassariella vexata TaxID=1141098 RepID=A0A1Y2DMR4_9PEZI|nr:uncharacterized protein BCR38DRAFT_476487 [Pseudomassariella vexata]ORY60541.1 hypothetical protein BCR38DRAFT_476487 [Pseudomassariella vexata]